MRLSKLLGQLYTPKEAEYGPVLVRTCDFESPLCVLQQTPNHLVRYVYPPLGLSPCKGQRANDKYWLPFIAFTLVLVFGFHETILPPACLNTNTNGSAFYLNRIAALSFLLICAVTK